MLKSRRDLRLLFIIGLALCLEAEVFGQATATTRSSATIVQGMSITNTQGLIFGAVIPGAGGSVSIDVFGNRTEVGTIILLTSGTFAFSAASFSLLGAPNLTYSITLPTSATLTLQGGSATILLTGFVSNPASTGTLSANGAGVLTVGGTVTISGSQAQGTYSGQFAVTLTYQ